MQTAGLALRTRIRHENPESHQVGVRASLDPNILSIAYGLRLSMF
jgi:hypothetical protein